MVLCILVLRSKSAISHRGLTSRSDQVLNREYRFTPLEARQVISLRSLPLGELPGLRDDHVCKEAIV